MEKFTKVDINQWYTRQVLKYFEDSQTTKQFAKSLHLKQRLLERITDPVQTKTSGRRIQIHHCINITSKTPKENSQTPVNNGNASE